MDEAARGRTGGRISWLLVAVLVVAVGVGPGLARAADPVASDSRAAESSKKKNKKKKSGCKKKKGKKKGKKRAGKSACSSEPTRSFSGTMTTTVQYSGCLVGQQTTQLPVTVTTGAPLRSTRVLPAAGGENNPFRIVVGQPGVAANIATGSVSLASAQRFASTFPAVIIQYWTLARNGAAVSGVLTEDGREQAAAYNLLASITELAPCFPSFGLYVNQDPIAEGATLSGTITNAALQLQINGAVFNQTRRFNSTVTANRSG